MRKGLIIALAAVLVLGLSGVALAWTAHDTGYVTDAGGGWASTINWAAGGAEGCVPDDCPGCPWDLKYDFSGQAGIIGVSGVGFTDIHGSGVAGSGSMNTEVTAWPGTTIPVAASRVFINDTVEAYVCQPCCEIDLYRAKTSVNVEDGQAYILDQQVSGMASNSGVVDPNPVTEQLLQTHGTAGNDIDGDGLSLTVRMDAERWSMDCMDGVFVFQEDHTMGVIGESVDFNVAAYQGMAHECSNLYGALGGPGECFTGCECIEDPTPDLEGLCPCCTTTCVLTGEDPGFVPIMSYGKWNDIPD